MNEQEESPIDSYRQLHRFVELMFLAGVLVFAGLACGNWLDNPSDPDKMPTVITMFVVAGICLLGIFSSLFMRIRHQR